MDRCFLWEMHRQNQLRRRTFRQAARTATLEDRVAALEEELDERDRMLEQLIERLETALGQDLDGKGTIGRR